jgi:hypothetical protein
VKVIQFEYLLRCHVGLPVEWCSNGHHAPHVGDNEAQVFQAAGNILHWCGWGKVTDYCLHRVFGIWEGKLVFSCRYDFMAEQLVISFGILTQYNCIGLLWWGELTEERLLRGSLGSSLCSSPFTWLQAWYDGGRCSSPHTTVQLQQLGISSVFLFSGYSTCRCPPLHH